LRGLQSQSGRGGKEKNSRSLLGLELPIIQPVPLSYPGSAVTYWPLIIPEKEIILLSLFAKICPLFSLIKVINWLIDNMYGQNNQL
jgi:hypothetical protein